jgi:hypothetical protein
LHLFQNFNIFTHGATNTQGLKRISHSLALSQKITGLWRPLLI